jgi:hypothetical protein
MAHWGVDVLMMLCAQNKKPSGVDTSSVPRPKLGNVLIGGAGIYDCVNDGEIAITFDDGPYLYTNDLLDKFKVCSARRPMPRVRSMLMTCLELRCESYLLHYGQQHREGND